MPSHHQQAFTAAPFKCVALASITLASCCSQPTHHNPTIVPNDATSAPPAVESTHAPPAAPISLEGWPAETFALPPGFAPELPTGSESLRFAPGWRDPASQDFWSYAFVMWIDEPRPDAQRLDHLLETYYLGLMSAFAAGTDHDVTSTPPQVDLVFTAPNVYEARMHLIDAFATFTPIDLRLLIAVSPASDTRSVVSIQVSPQPPLHTIWQSLRAAISEILAQHQPAHNAGL